MIRRPPRSTQSRSSAASDVYKRQLIDERRKKREALVDLGIDPYPTRFDRTAMADDLHERHAGLDADVRTGEHVRLAGRVTAVRDHGKLSFVTLSDASGSIQLLLQAA